MDLQKNKWIKRAIIIACVAVVLMIVAILIKTAMFPPYDGLAVSGSYALSIALVFVMVCVITWINESKSASDFNLRLKEYQEEINKSLIKDM